MQIYEWGRKYLETLRVTFFICSYFLVIFNDFPFFKVCGYVFGIRIIDSSSNIFGKFYISFTLVVWLVCHYYKISIYLGFCFSCMENFWAKYI